MLESTPGADARARGADDQGSDYDYDQGSDYDEYDGYDYGDDSSYDYDDR